MAYDLALDTEGKDLVLNSGKFSMTSSVKQLLRQRMYMTFRTLRGEWFRNPDFGGYNREIFFDSNATENSINAFYLSLLNSFPEVARVKSFDGEFLRRDRVYRLTFVVDTVDGQQGAYAINLIPPGVEIPYPDPTNVLSQDDCEVPTIDNANTYYEYLNITLATTERWL